MIWLWLAVPFAAWVGFVLGRITQPNEKPRLWAPTGDAKIDARDGWIHDRFGDAPLEVEGAAREGWNMGYSECACRAVAS